jgi:hypothetical protein
MARTRQQNHDLPPKTLAAIRRWERDEGVSLSEHVYPPLTTLFRARCDPVKILKLLRAYYAPVDKQARAALEVERKRARKTAASLRKLAGTVKKYDDKFALLSGLPDDMCGYAEFLERFWVGEGGSPGDLNTVLRRGGGRQLYLYLACVGIQQLSGKPHYREIAEIAGVLSGSTESEDTIRKMVSRFRGWWKFDLPKPDVAIPTG